MTSAITAHTAAVDVVNNTITIVLYHALVVIARGSMLHMFCFRRRFSLRCLQTILWEITTVENTNTYYICLLYTSDAADE